jgi:hypothetical protein
VAHVARLVAATTSSALEGDARVLVLGGLDFTEAPRSSAVLRNSGLSLERARRVPVALFAARRVCAIDIGELRPAHAVALGPDDRAGETGT